MPDEKYIPFNPLERTLAEALYWRIQGTGGAEGTDMSVMVSLLSDLNLFSAVPKERREVVLNYVRMRRKHG
jgi:hypothetical protein